MPTKDKTSKRVRKNFRLPPDLATWIDAFARRKNTNMTQIIIDYFTDLRKRNEA